MGFGLIFCGYITLLFFKVLPPAMAVGLYAVYRGLKKLSPYGKSFRMCSGFSAALAVYYVLFSAVWLGRMFGVFEGILNAPFFGLCDDILYYALLFGFHLTLYMAIEGISRECGYEKGIKKVYFSRVLLAMFYVLTLINIPLYYFGVKSYLPLACFLCELVWIIYTALLIYGCYMRIATDEIIEEEEKKIAAYNARMSNKKCEK